MRTIRILNSIAGERFAFAPGQVVQVGAALAADLVKAKHAEYVEETTAVAGAPERAVSRSAKTAAQGGQG